MPFILSGVTSGYRSQLEPTSHSTSQSFEDSSWDHQDSREEQLGLEPEVLYSVTYRSHLAFAPSYSDHRHVEVFTSSLDAIARAWELFAGHVDFPSAEWMDFRGNKLIFEVDDVFHVVTFEQNGCLRCRSETFEGDRMGLTRGDRIWVNVSRGVRMPESVHVRRRGG